MLHAIAPSAPRLSVIAALILVREHEDVIARYFENPTLENLNAKLAIQRTICGYMRGITVTELTDAEIDEAAVHAARRDFGGKCHIAGLASIGAALGEPPACDGTADFDLDGEQEAA